MLCLCFSRRKQFDKYIKLYTIAKSKELYLTFRTVVLRRSECHSLIWNNEIIPALRFWRRTERVPMSGMRCQATMDSPLSPARSVCQPINIILPSTWFKTLSIFLSFNALGNITKYLYGTFIRMVSRCEDFLNHQNTVMFCLKLKCWKIKKKIC